MSFLGRGGFGIVKLADLSSPNQDAPVTVAVKQLHTDGTSDVRLRMALVRLLIPYVLTLSLTCCLRDSLVK